MSRPEHPGEKWCVTHDRRAFLVYGWWFCAALNERCRVVEK